MLSKIGTYLARYLSEPREQLGLAAARRGFGVEIYVTDSGVHFVDSVRDPGKKEVIALVQEDMREQLQELGVAIHHEELDPQQLRARFQTGAIPLALLSSWQIYEAKVPHWVVISGFDDHFVYVNDPFVDDERVKPNWTRSTCRSPTIPSTISRATAAAPCVPSCW